MYRRTSGSRDPRKGKGVLTKGELRVHTQSGTPGKAGKSLLG